MYRVSFCFRVCACYNFDSSFLGLIIILEKIHKNVAFPVCVKYVFGVIQYSVFHILATLLLAIKLVLWRLCSGH